MGIGAFLAGVGLVISSVIGSGAPTVAPASFPKAPITDAQLHFVSDRQLSPRLHELTFTTPALVAPTHVRVLLPAGFDASGRTRYPTLYLLHGGFADYTSWTVAGNAEKLTEGFPFVVVMSDTSGFGNYVDWYNHT